MGDAGTATSDIRQEEVELRTALNEFTSKYEIEKLIGRDRLGSEASFESMRLELEHILGLTRQVSQCQLRDIPGPLLGALKDRVNEAAAVFDRMLAYNPRQGHSASTHGELTNHVNRLWNELFGYVHPILAAEAHAPSTRRLDEFRHFQDSARKVIDDLTRKADKANAMLEDIRKASAETGVSQQAMHFKMDADGHWRAAWWWATGSAILAIMLAYIAIRLFSSPAEVRADANGLRHFRSQASPRPPRILRASGVGAVEWAAIVAEDVWAR